jgi:hypothetical protein
VRIIPIEGGISDSEANTCCNFTAGRADAKSTAKLATNNGDAMSDDDEARPQRGKMPPQKYVVSPGGARAAWNRARAVAPRSAPATFGHTEGVAGAFATAKAKTVVAKLTKLSSNAGDFEAREFVERIVEPELVRLTHEVASANAREMAAVREARKANQKADKAARLLALNTIERHKQERTIDALVGTGFTSGRTLRRHADMWCSRIQADYDGDTKKQVMLATAVAERLALKAHSARTPAEERATNFTSAFLRNNSVDIRGAVPERRASCLVGRQHGRSNLWEIVPGREGAYTRREA